jgi:hypothetical protein
LKYYKIIGDEIKKIFIGGYSNRRQTAKKKKKLRTDQIKKKNQANIGEPTKLGLISKTCNP